MFIIFATLFAFLVGGGIFIYQKLEKKEAKNMRPKPLELDYSDPFILEAIKEVNALLPDNPLMIPVMSSALYSNTVGNYNVALGSSTLRLNTTGIQPTSDIIESGSNANGSYRKYKDGTLMCYTGTWK